MDTTTLPPPAFSPFTPVDGFDTDVVVVGLGPAGGTAALALATYGVRVHAVTMFPWVANSPRAHITNQRAVEVLRDLGLEEEARKYATPWDQMGDTLFTTSLAGEEIVRLQTWGTGDQRSGDYLQGSPCTMLDIPQPLMEPLLIKNAAERGAIVSFNTEYLDHEQDADGVTVRFRDGRTGHVFTQRARYLLGVRRRPVADRRADRAAVRGRARPRRHRLHHLQRRPEPLRRAPAEHPALDLQLEGRLRRDRHGPAARHPAVERVDRRLGLRHGQRRAGPVRRRRARPDPHPGRRPRPRGRDRAQVAVVRQPAARHQLPGRPGASAAATPCTGTRRRSGLGSNTSHAGRVQPGLEGRVRRQGPRRPGPARLLHRRAGPGRRSRSSPGPTSPARTTPALREWFDRDSDDPVARRAGQAQGAQPRGRRAPRAALRGAGAEEHRVQRARRGAQPALRLRRRHPRPDGRRGGSGRGTASSTCRPPPGPGPSSRTPGSSARTAAASPPWTSPARDS